MSDNIAMTQGSGTTIATDDVSGTHYQRIKLTDSTADSSTPTGVLANPLKTVAHDPNAIHERVTDTSGTSTAFTNFSAVASTKNYICAISVFNSSGTDGYIDFRVGTGGSVLWTIAIPAGGGAVMASDRPLFKTTASTALAYDVSGALSTVYISVSGYQAA